MSNQEQKTDMKQELTVVYEAGGQQIKLTPSIVQQYIVGDSGQITLPEFKFFTELCKARKLNPFLKEAYCIKFGSNPAQIVVGKDAVLKRAVLNSCFDGLESGVIVQNIQSGELTERAGTFYLRGTENLVGGWAKVYRKDWTHPTYCSVAFDEVAQRKSGGALNTNWANKGATMVEKVAKVRALREAFVEDLSGMYEADEMPMQADEMPLPEIIPQDEPVEEAITQGEPTEEPIDVSFDEL
ncbi:phage recombination protein Bet [Ruminococcus sp.]|uniref:phage recombination protein Bet n=1 Tax=Ruminococcus sp. TaxID=41978 RepID=UPI001B740EF4|nr:phage recombination protein Bet [Ruminococcus sp.]MBP5431011.1 phage recombination protein Bet [Ruminococcus sp.]